MEFLYPTSRQFPVDEVCSQIVAALEKRHWRAPGIKVKVDNYGSGEQKLRYVSSIEGDDFRLHFCRSQRLLPGNLLNDIAAINSLQIPKKILHVYEDESGPTLWLYVGDNWDADRASFFPDYNQKLHGKPRTQIRYSGSYSGSYSGLSRGQRALRLHPAKDYREYEPGDGDPSWLDTSAVMEEFRAYLHDVVLASIEALPIPSEPFDVLAVPATVPLPAGMGPFFTRAGHVGAGRIKRGKSPSLRDDLALAHRYGLSPKYRLTTLGTPNDGTFPEIAYDGFVWCGLELTDVARDGAPGARYRGGFDDDYVIRVTPTSANDIYIADHGVYEKAREALAKSIGGQRDSFTDQDVRGFEQARARTLISITEYRGGYAQPVVLIGRELAFDEVEIVREPLPGDRR